MLEKLSTLELDNLTDASARIKLNCYSITGESLPDRLNLVLICILEAKGDENRVKLSIACSRVLSPYTYIRIQCCGTINSLRIFLCFNTRISRCTGCIFFLNFFFENFIFYSRQNIVLN